MTLYPEDIERYGQPTDEPTEADPGKAWAEHMRLSLAEVLGADEVEQWAAMDDPGAQRWHLLAASHEKLRALVGGRSAAPTRDEVDLRLADAQQHNGTLKGERDEARAAVVETREILDALIEWFGAPDWAGPDLPVELGRRIATLLGPRSAMDRVRAPWALLSRSAAPTREQVQEAIHDAYVAEVKPPSFLTVASMWQLADAVVALLSRSAEPPRSPTACAYVFGPYVCAKVADHDGEHVGAQAGEWRLPSGVAAEPNEEHGDG